jgi:Holliday junction resolvase RusA-like endonuclease
MVHNHSQVTILGSVALPPPPSANRLWKTFRGRAVRSAEFNNWLKEAVIQIQSNIRPTSGPVAVRLVLHLGSGVMRTADLDNFLKPTLDALKPETRHKETGQVTKPGAGVIADDNLEVVRSIELDIRNEGPKVHGKRPPAELIVEVWAL